MGVQYHSKIPKVLMDIDKSTRSSSRLVLEDLDREAYKLAPAVTNEMRNARQAIHDANGGKIIYPKIYSARLYFGETFNFSKAENPRAGALWGRRAIAKNRKKWRAFIAKHLKGGLS